jgi:hypothetical protein
MQIDLAAKSGEVELFSNADHPQYSLIKVYVYHSGFTVKLKSSNYYLLSLVIAERC